jgi:hypothetical protein
MIKTSCRTLLMAAVLASTLCGCCWQRPTWTYFRSNAVPDKLPLGSVNRAHWHTQEANGEAADFILHRCDFVGETAELTPDAKDRILEIGARMRSTPFPVLVERSRNNADPELDALRRDVVCSILADLGNRDAGTRVVVSPAYGKGLNSQESATDYYQYLFTRGGVGGGNLGGGGFGGGGFGAAGASAGAVAF